MQLHHWSEIKKTGKVVLEILPVLKEIWVTKKRWKLFHYILFSWCADDSLPSCCADDCAFSWCAEYCVFILWWWLSVSCCADDCLSSYCADDCLSSWCAAFSIFKQFGCLSIFCGRLQSVQTVFNFLVSLLFFFTEFYCSPVFL